MDGLEQGLLERLDWHRASLTPNRILHQGAHQVIPGPAFQS